MIYKLKKIDGGVSIARIIDANTTIEKEIEKLETDAKGVRVKMYSDFKEISEIDIPSDREYRDAWDFNGKSKTINIDIEKAKSVFLDNLRVKRNERLKELDIYTLKGIDVQDEKQRLRDLPQVLDLSKAKNVSEFPIKEDLIKG